MTSYKIDIYVWIGMVIVMFSHHVLLIDQLYAQHVSAMSVVKPDVEPAIKIAALVAPRNQQTGKIKEGRGLGVRTHNAQSFSKQRCLHQSTTDTETDTETDKR